MAEIRASDIERERTVEALRGHAAAGRLDSGELEERLGLALAAVTRADLARLVEDLPSEERRRPAIAPAPVRARGCGMHAGHSPRHLLGIAVLLVAIWALTGADYFWPVWPLLGMAIPMLMHRRRSNPGVIGNTAHTSNTLPTQ